VDFTLPLGNNIKARVPRTEKERVDTSLTLFITARLSCS